MRTTIKRALLLFLALCIMLPPLAGAEGLENAEITLGYSETEYNGTEQTPQVTVTLGGQTLTETIDYTVQYEDNRDAGNATVTVTGTGSYTGSNTGHFKITPRTIKISDIDMVECIKAYDGNKFATPKLSATVLPGDSVSIEYGKKTLYDDCYVGVNKKVTVAGMSPGGTDGKNYKLESSSAVFYNGEITHTAETITGKATISTGETYDLRILFGSVPTYSIGTDDDLLGGTLSGSEFTAGQPGTFTFSSTENEKTVTVTVISSDSSGGGSTEEQTPTDPSTQEPGGDSASSATDPEEDTAPASGSEQLVLTGESTMTYGTSQTLYITGSTGGTITYTVESLSGKGAAEISSAGVMRATEAGTVLITATDGHASTPQALLVDITPATIRIAVKDRTATTGDPVPVLTASDYTVSGLVGNDKLKQLPTLSYTTEPDMTKSGTVGIRASGAIVPEGGNYALDIVYTDGTMTIQEDKTYAVTLRQSIHGTISANRTTAKQGDTITVTAVPEDSYALNQITVTADDGSSVSVKDSRFTMPDANVTVSALFEEQTTTPQLPFRDVSESDWFFDSVCYVYQNNLMNGTSETAFSPQGTTTRGMLVTILYRMEGSPTAPQRQPFGDVPSGAYYADPVAWCAWNGIVNGTGATTFSPNSPITREQLATIFYRYVGWKGLSQQGSGNLAQFSDEALVQSYAREAVGWAVGKGILSGKGNGILDPGGQATRAETAAILQRVKTLFGI